MNRPATNTPPLRCESDAIAAALASIFEPGQVTELRVLDAVTSDYRRPHVEFGYFNDPDKLAEAAASILTAKGFYFVPNPVNPALLARALNRIRCAEKNPSTSDPDVTRRRWLLIDADPVRPADISSSDAEHEAALLRCGEIVNWLHDDGWGDPIGGDSGNGGHLMYRTILARAAVVVAPSSRRAAGHPQNVRAGVGVVTVPRADRQHPPLAPLPRLGSARVGKRWRRSRNWKTWVRRSGRSSAIAASSAPPTGRTPTTCMTPGKLGASRKAATTLTWPALRARVIADRVWKRTVGEWQEVKRRRAAMLTADRQPQPESRSRQKHKITIGGAPYLNAELPAERLDGAGNPIPYSTCVCEHCLHAYSELYGRPGVCSECKWDAAYAYGRHVQRRDLWWLGFGGSGMRDKLRRLARVEDARNRDSKVGDNSATVPTAARPRGSATVFTGTQCPPPAKDRSVP